jgi:hypothetical protein
MKRIAEAVAAVPSMADDCDATESTKAEAGQRKFTTIPVGRTNYLATKSFAKSSAEKDVRERTKNRTIAKSSQEYEKASEINDLSTRDAAGWRICMANCRRIATRTDVRIVGD